MLAERSRRQGSALVVVLIMIMILTSLSAFMLTSAFQKAKSADVLIENTKSLHLAEAGIDRAMAAVNTEALTFVPANAYPSTATINATDLSGGTYAVTIVRGLDVNGNGTIAGAADAGVYEDYYYTITSIGTGVKQNPNVREQSVTKTVEVVVKRKTGVGFHLAMFGDIGVDLRGAVLTDSYNSNVRPYDPANRGSKGDVASNQLVQLGGTVDVWGSATSGPAYTTDQGTAFVSGSTASATDTITLTPVTYAPPAGCLPAVPGGTVATSITNGVTLGTGNYRCSSIALANKQAFVVNGDAVLYVDGDIHMTAQSYIKVASGSLTIYHNSGGLDLTGGNEVNGYYDKTARTSVMGKPAQMLIFSNTDQSIKLVGNAESSMCLYAPRAEIDLRGNYDFFGAVIGRSIMNTGTPDFHYDEALGDLVISTPGPCELKAWREIAP